MISISLGLSRSARLCWEFDLGLVLGLFRSARLSSRYCFSRLLWLALCITLGLFRSTRACYRFHLGIFLGLFRSTRFSTRHCGLPFTQNAGLGWLLHMLARQRPHVVALLSARVIQRSGCATNFRLLMYQLHAIRLLARSYAGAPTRPHELWRQLLFARALRLSLGSGWRRGSACSPWHRTVRFLLR